MAEYTEQETDQVRRAVLNAMAYVSKSDPGFFAAFSESAAGARALAAAPENVRSLLTGGFILPEVPDLQAALASVSAKDPADAEALKQVVLAAVQQVAEASKGVQPEEQQAVDRIRQALA